MSGLERPDPADLLAIARQTLLDDIAPQLPAEARFKLLMVANAMAIAARAAQAGLVPELADIRTICTDIRAGRYDDDAAMAQRLLAYADARCSISSKPTSKVE